MFRKLFAEESAKLADATWLFTDASKNNNCVGFAVVNKDNIILSAGVLPECSSVFTAEATAILRASEIAHTNRGKYVICTDSLSTLEAIKNLNCHNKIISDIRSLSIKHASKICFFWVPSHTGITGNELADKAANHATRAPVFANALPKGKDLQRLLSKLTTKDQSDDLALFSHRYKTFNPSGIAPRFPVAANTKSLGIFIRLRLGHTQITYGHHLSKQQKPTCSCGQPLKVDPLLDHCQDLARIRTTLFANATPSSFLSIPSIDNIENIRKLLSNCKYKNQI